MDWENSVNQSTVNSSTPAFSSSLSSSESSSFSSSCCNSSPIFSASSFSGLDLLFNLKILFIPLYSAVVLIACSGNLLLLFSHLGTTRKTQHYSIFSSATWPRMGIWILHVSFCHCHAVCAVYAAVLSLMAIAVDRYVVVAYPIRKRARLPVLLGSASHTVYLDLRATGLQMAVCEEFWDGQERGRLIYSCFILFFSYFVPLAAVSISYCAISHQLKKRTKSGLTACPELRSARATWSRRRKKTFCLLLVSVVCFAFSWLPLQTFSIIGKNYINVIQVFQHLFAMSSACYNPFIYASLITYYPGYLKILIFKNKSYF
uniref:Prolactin releasing hormone receptor n=1 Tax=Amphiprion percula TaxID=161767 RepID=A0A3P8U5C1_AMPPE